MYVIFRVSFIYDTHLRCAAQIGTYGLVEHARLSFLVLTLRTIDESVAQHVVVYAAIAALSIGCGTREPLHAVHRRWTLFACAQTKNERTKIDVRNRCDIWMTDDDDDDDRRHVSGVYYKCWNMDICYFFCVCMWDGCKGGGIMRTDELFINVECPSSARCRLCLGFVRIVVS